MPEIPIELWLKPEDIGTEKEITFADVGGSGEIAKPVGEDNIKTFEIGVLLPDGTKRVWTMNKTSQRAIAQSYGTNTDNWKGKKVVAYTSLQNVRGKEKKVIYAKVPVGTS